MIDDLYDSQKYGQQTFPGFDHYTKDPTENKHMFHRNVQQIVIVEGLYTLLNEAPWNTFKYDKTYFLDTPVRKTIQRLKDRMKFQMDLTKKEAKERVHNNDLLNDSYIRENSKVDTKFQIPQNLVDEFHEILQTFCRIEKVRMPKDYTMYLSKSFDKIEERILGPQKDWSGFQIIDTAVNLHHFKFDEDREQIIEKSKKFGVQKMIELSRTMRRSVKASEEGLNATIGYIPSKSESFDLEYIKQALKDHKFVAIKAGLDYEKQDILSKQEQRKIFIELIDLAQ